MGDLATELRKAHSVVNWFALGEAKALAHDINTALAAPKPGADPAKAAENLKAVARRTAAFLSARSTPEAHTTARDITRVLAASRT